MYAIVFRPAAVALATLLAFAACTSGSVTPSASASAQAASKADLTAGANVKATLAALSGAKATLSFGTVKKAGSVSLTTTTTAPALPAGFSLVGGTYFDLKTDAEFDKATVCFEDAKVDAKSKLLHYSGGKWQDITTSVNAPQICGEASSFSPFGIVQGQAAQASPTPTATESPSATPTATATAEATATATATATAAPATTPVPVTTTKTPTPTQAPTATPAPTAKPTPTPSPTPAEIAKPAKPASLGIYGRITDAQGKGIGGACVTLGPPISCWTKTSQSNTNPADTGYYSIDLGKLAAQSGSTWDIYVVVKNYTSYTYENWYSGTFTVSGVVTKDHQFQ